MAFRTEDSLLRLRASMNETAHLIGKQDADLLWFDDRRHFAMAEGRMVHRLSFPIFACPIVGRAVFTGWSRGRHGLTFFECGFYAALRAVHTRDLSTFGK